MDDKNKGSFFGDLGSVVRAVDAPEYDWQVTLLKLIGAFLVVTISYISRALVGVVWGLWKFCTQKPSRP